MTLASSPSVSSQAAASQSGSRQLAARQISRHFNPFALQDIRDLILRGR